MVTDDLLERLRYRGEGTDLDYKQQQYRFVKAGDHEKSELLKDVLAMANADRAGTGYILIGFADRGADPAEVVGILADDHLDDASLQQFVNEKVDPKVTFRYDEVRFDGKHVAVISIPLQDRPFYTTKDFGKVRRHAVYVRRGSSTAEASPREVLLMGRPSPSVPRLALSFFDETDRPLSSEADLVFFLPGDRALPDHRPSPGISLPIGFNDRFTNRDYWRQLFDYGFIHARKIQVRPALLNEGASALTDVKLEVLCTAETGDSVQLVLGSQLPEVPRSNGLPLPAGSHLVGRNAEVSVRRGIHVAALSFGKIFARGATYATRRRGAPPQSAGLDDHSRARVRQ